MIGRPVDFLTENAAQREVALSVPATGDEEWQALREPLQSGWLTQGPKVKAFEEAFATRHQVAHAVATTSGTTALHLALVALGIGPGDEVIVPAFTWVATANAVVYTGATPVFVDVRPDTYNIDPDGVAVALTERTKAVMAVDTATTRYCKEIPHGLAACAAGLSISTGLVNTGSLRPPRASISRVKD